MNVFLPKYRFLIRYLLLFIVTGFVVSFFQKYVIYYQSQLPVFLYDKTYFFEFLSFPGGLADYATAFLRQFYIYSWAGVLITTAIIFSIAVLFVSYFRLLNILFNSSFLLLVPTFIFTLLHNNFEYNMAHSVSVVLSLGLAVFSLKRKACKKIVRLIIYVITGYLSYIVTGGGFLFYVFLIVIGEISLFRDGGSGVYIPVIIVVYGVLLPYLSYLFLYPVTLKNAFLYLIPTNASLDVSILLVSFGVFFLLLFVVSWFFEFNKRANNESKESGNILKRFYVDVVVIILFGAFLYIISMLRVDDKERVRLEVQYYADNKMWDDILKTTSKEHVIDRLVSFHINRALFYTGKMSSEMFHYPQNYGVDGLFIDRYNDNRMLESASDIYFDLGFINESKHWAYEAFVFYGNKPRLLKRLALIYIINNNYKAALKYLNTLSNTLFYKEWANKYKILLSDEEKVRKDSLISEKRRFSPHFDFFSDRQNPDLIMKFLLKANKKNQMAFEYLIAYYMLANKFISFRMNLIQYGVLDYFKQIPLSYQEALLVYLNISGKAIEDCQFKIENTVFIDFKSYGGIINRYKGNLITARKSLEVNYGNTYWYYLNYVSPVTNKIEIEESEKVLQSYR